MNFAPPKNRGKCNYGHKCNINNITYKQVEKCDCI